MSAFPTLVVDPLEHRRHSRQNLVVLPLRKELLEFARELRKAE